MTQYCSLLFFALSLLTTATAICYYPNRKSEPGTEHQPCNSIEGHVSFCCATNRTYPTESSLDVGDISNIADVCMPNGLCKFNVTGLETTYYRSMCTSPDWPEASCAKPCDNYKTGSTPRMTPCGNSENSTEWCCGTDTNCCGTSDAVFIAPVLSASHSPSSSSSASTSPTATSLPSNTPSTDSSLSAGAMAGIGVGTGVGVVVILGALGYFWMRHRKAAAGDYTPAPMADKNIGMDNRDPGSHGQDPRKQMMQVELEGSNMGELHELNAGELRHELGDGREYG